MRDLERATYRNGCNDGLTVREIRKATGASLHMINRYLHEANDRGMLVTGRKPATNLMGIVYPTPCYKIKAPKRIFPAGVKNRDKRK